MEDEDHVSVEEVDTDSEQNGDEDKVPPQVSPN